MARGRESDQPDDLAEHVANDALKAAEARALLDDREVKEMVVLVRLDDDTAATGAHMPDGADSRDVLALLLTHAKQLSEAMGMDFGLITSDKPIGQG